MRKLLIFGNSGSGKSTLAKAICREHSLAHLDLDTIAWLAQTPPTRREISESKIAIERFVADHRGWVIEGCYADLLEVVTPFCSEMIFLNPGIDACIENCRSRPWEPHKYPSKEAQDANLEMLIRWVREYATRTDEFSLFAHRRVFDNFAGRKSERIR